MDTVRVCAEVNSGRKKIPCHTVDLNPCQYCCWLFSQTVYQLSYPDQVKVGSIHNPVYVDFDFVVVISEYCVWWVYAISCLLPMPSSFFPFKLKKYLCGKSLYLLIQICILSRISAMSISVLLFSIIPTPMFIIISLVIVDTN